MKEVNISKLETLDNLSSYPKDTMFVLDKSEKEIKIPDCLKKIDRDAPKEMKESYKKYMKEEAERSKLGIKI